LRLLDLLSLLSLLCHLSVGQCQCCALCVRFCCQVLYCDVCLALLCTNKWRRRWRWVQISF